MSRWEQLRTTLASGTEVQHWSASKGRLNGNFEIIDVEAGHLELRNRMGNLRRITRKDFDNIEAVWPDYLAGELSRKRLTEISLNSTYIISLLHWIEDGSSAADASTLVPTPSSNVRLGKAI